MAYGITTFVAACPRCGTPCEWLARARSAGMHETGVEYEIRCGCGPLTGR